MAEFLRIDTGRSAPVSPNLFGQFIEHLDNCIRGGVFEPGSPLSDGRGFRKDVLEKARALRPPVLRWPGGTYVNIFHWMDSVGPKEQRRRHRNLIWGGVEDALFGTCEFIEYCRALGAEPCLCVNLSTGSSEEAAHWVEYVNGEEDSYYANLRRSHGYPQPFGVKYWGIGNENYAEPDLGSLHDPDRFVTVAWEFVKHMKLTDPSIELIFPGNMGDARWNETLLSSLAPVCDYLSIHYYAHRGPEDYAELFQRCEEFDGQLAQAELLASRFPDEVQDFPFWYRFPARKHPIYLAVDEWGIWNLKDRTPEDPYGLKGVYDWRDALWVASAMQRMLSHPRVQMANMAQMVNILAPICAHPGGSWVQTIFHPMALFRERCGSAAVAVERENMQLLCPNGPEALSAAATLDGQGVTLLLANRTPERALKVRIELDGRPASWARRIVELNAPSWRAINGPDAPDCVERRAWPDAALEDGVLELPPHAIYALSIE